MNYGAPFCRAVEPYLANLKTLLAEAEANGVGDWPAIVSARAVYDDVDSFVAYVPLFGNDCERHTKEVQAAIEKVKIVLNSMSVSTWTPRPDAEPSSEGLPSWTKWALFGVLGIAALHYITPLVPRRRLAGGRR